MVETPIRRGYEQSASTRRHPTIRPGPPRGTLVAVAVASAVAAGVTTRSPLAVALGAVVTWAIARRPGPVLLAALLAGGGAIRAGASWDGLAPDRLGAYHGWSQVVDEAQHHPGASRVILEIEGERHEMWLRGRARRERVDTWRAGEHVLVSGERVTLDARRRRRVAWQHVVGSFDATWLGDVRPGGPIAVASNRVRDLIERGMATLPADRAALGRGLVIGDDRDQPPEMVQRFRDSGLAHLSAVSGQNVALLMAAAGPLLARARPFGRWALSVALVGWFVVLTRAEPSILRAGMMAALGATAYALGREREAVRSLAVAVVVLLLVDPLLAWSVGFWLSVGATAGVTGAGPWLAGRLHRLGPLSMPVAVTVGAQAGVAIPSILVFGRLSLVGTVANLVAVPIAGLVMLYGLPASLLAGAVPAVAPLVMAPVGWGARWVDAVATVAAALEPPAPWSWLGWVLLVVVLGGLIRAGRPHERRPPP